jgi:hypothetical protein
MWVRVKVKGTIRYINLAQVIEAYVSASHVTLIYADSENTLTLTDPVEVGLVAAALERLYRAALREGESVS